MPTRKRGRAEMEAASSEPPVVPAQVLVPTTTAASSLLTRLRNDWHFANLMQYIFIFGKVVKIDEEFDMEELENECLKPGPSEKLAEIGLCLLKFVSSHRGLTPDMFDEYTRRQYVARAPDQNPFGTAEEPAHFENFDAFLQLRVLVQLSQWTFNNPDRLRERMPEAKDAEQTSWRIEELGYDRHDRMYYILDDDRLYRLSEPAPEPPKYKPKAKSKAGRAIARAEKRRRSARNAHLDGETEDGTEEAAGEAESKPVTHDDGLGGRKWECIAITLQEYDDFLASIAKSKDPNEQILHERVVEDVMPIIQKAEDSRQKKVARREKELLNMEKLAGAKRSSRLQQKQEREREEVEAVESARRRQEALVAARKDAELQRELDEARQSRMMTREHRLKEREYKRVLHEEELQRLAKDSELLGKGDSRMSERHLRAEMERKKKELEELQQQESWVFDCAKCGVYGENIDDGSHSVACERCNVWQHSACLGVSQAAVEKDDFHFVCKDCIRKEEDAKRPPLPTIKLRLGPLSSPPSNSPRKRESEGSPGEPGMPPMKKFKRVEVPRSSTIKVASPPSTITVAQNPLLNGPTLQPQGQVSRTTSTNTVAAPAPPPSPTCAQARVNGYHTSASSPNAAPSNSAAVNANAYRSFELKAQSPPQVNGHGHAAAQPLPPITQTPSQSFSNDLGRPLSTPSARPWHANPNINGPSPSPSQASVMPSSPATNLPPPAKATNGTPSGISPQKHPPPTPVRAPTGHVASTTAATASSPQLPRPATVAAVAAAAAAGNRVASSGGESPVKHSRPRPGEHQQEQQQQQQQQSQPPHPPPIPKLSPSPRAPSLHVLPVKQASPELQTHGVGSSPLTAPAKLVKAPLPAPPAYVQ